LSDLFSRGETALAPVEQANRWLCQPAVIPILSPRIREYLLSNVLGSVTVGVRNQPTVVTDVQPALDALAVVGSAAGRTRLRRIPFGDRYDLDTLDLGFVREHRREAVERPPVQIEVAVVAPIGGFAVVLADAREVADDNRANVAFDTLRDNFFRESMQEVCPAVGALLELILIRTNFHQRELEQ
jgi:hypothetical protein